MVSGQNSDRLRITFIFTSSSDLKTLPAADIFRIHFDVHGAAANREDCVSRVQDMALQVGQLTRAALHLTVEQLGIKQQLIKPPHEDSAQLQHSMRSLPIVFESHTWSRTQRRNISVLLPVSLPRFHFIVQGSKKKSLRRSLIRPSFQISAGDDQIYVDAINRIVDHALVLLNSDPQLEEQRKWQYVGFCPSWRDSKLITRFNTQSKKRRAEERKQERLEKKRLAAIEKGYMLPVTTLPVRRGRSVPGEFRGVQMRSQLEIRFAAQLEKRGIHWQYEVERLGKGNYLVDFYLPKLGVWIEVKGQFEPRDEFLLPEVAAYLAEERQERLFVFTQREAFWVNGENYERLIHDDFWEQLVAR